MTGREARMVIPKEGTPEEIQCMNENWGWTKEQINNLTLRQRRNVRVTPMRRAIKLIAEVVKAENCACKPKIGDRIIINGAGIVAKRQTTFPYLCLFALAPLLPFVYVVYDRCVDGLDPSPQGFGDHVRCCDVGVGCGGWGEVMFKVYCVSPPPEK